MPACAVQEPNCPWSSTGEHHGRRSSLVLRAAAFAFTLFFAFSFSSPRMVLTVFFTPRATCFLFSSFVDGTWSRKSGRSFNQPFPLFDAMLIWIDLVSVELHLHFWLIVEFFPGSGNRSLYT